MGFRINPTKSILWVLIGLISKVFLLSNVILGFKSHLCQKETYLGLMVKSNHQEQSKYVLQS